MPCNLAPKQEIRLNKKYQNGVPEIRKNRFEVWEAGWSMVLLQKEIGSLCLKLMGTNPEGIKGVAVYFCNPGFPEVKAGD